MITVIPPFSRNYKEASRRGGSMYPDYDNSDSNTFLTQPTTSVSTIQWTWLADKLFEEALVLFQEGTSNRWQKIAERVPGKSPMEVREHYNMLLYDLHEIDSGRVEIPSYYDELTICDSNNQIYFASKSKQQMENERKKGNPWTEEEHKYVLNLDR